MNLSKNASLFTAVSDVGSASAFVALAAAAAALAAAPPGGALGRFARPALTPTASAPADLFFSSLARADDDSFSAKAGISSSTVLMSSSDAWRRWRYSLARCWISASEALARLLAAKTASSVVLISGKRFPCFT